MIHWTTGGLLILGSAALLVAWMQGAPTEYLALALIILVVIVSLWARADLESHDHAEDS